MSESAREEIQRINREFSARFARGDHEGVAALYTEDARFLSPGRGVARGREEIREVFAAYAAAGVTDFHFETLEVDDHGDVVVELARSTASMGSSGQVQEFLYCIVWHRDADGELRLHWDVVSASQVR